MPTKTQNDVQSTRFLTEPRRALLTPSASPSLGPPDRPPTKRPRHRSTPTSSKSTTPSTSNDSTSSTDVNSARRASTLRVLNTWAQLAERYNKRLDEDDIIDLHRYVIIKDRGAVEGASKEYHIGHFTQLDGDQDYPDDDQDQEDSEQDDDDNELNGSEAATDDDVAISKKELLRGVPPLSATTDAEDLREFLEAERKRRELAGDEENDEVISAEQRSALKKELEERQRKKEAALASRTRDEASAEPATLEDDAEATPTRSSARAPPSDIESEDELAAWTHDESTAVYPVAQHESHEGQEVIELTDSDSDKEFAAILTHPPRFVKAVSQSSAIQKPPQSPPDSERGRSKSRTRPRPKVKKVEATGSDDQRPSPRVVRKPEVVLALRKKPSVSNGTTVISDERTSASDPRLSPARKGKSKEITPLEDDCRKKTPKSVGPHLGRKRKRISSSSINGSSPLALSPSGQLASGEPKNTLRRHGKSTSQIPTALPRSHSPGPTSDEEPSIDVQYELTAVGPSHPLISPASGTQPKVPACKPLEPESVELNPHDYNSSRPLLSDPPIPVGHPYSQRYSPRLPSNFSSPNQVTPSLSLPAHPPPPIDLVQAQQAHYLLAQAMHQLSYLLSTTMPPYAAYVSDPGQPWHPPPPPLPLHPAYSTPIHHHPHSHGTRYLHPSSSSMSRSGLPPSSPIRSSMSPPVEERARSRGRSRSRGRRVSFQLDSEEVIGIIQPELQPSGQKNRKQTLEVNRERGKARATEELDNSLRLEARGSLPREIGRGRTPGPSTRKINDGPRGRSLSRG